MKSLRRFVLTFVILLLAWNVSANEIDKYKMSLSLYNEGFIDIAGKSFAEFLTDYPTSMYRKKALYYLALTEIQGGDYKNAVTHLNEVANDKKFEFYNDTIYYLTLGYFTIGKYAESEKYLGLVLQNNLVTEQSDASGYEKLLYMTVINNINLGKYEKALTKATEYLQKSHFTTYRYDIEKYLLNYYIQSADYYNAAQMCMLIFEEPKLNNTDKILVEYNYILSLYEQRKFSEAVGFFAENVSYYNEALYLLVSECYYGLDDKQKCVQYLNEVYSRKHDLHILLRIATLYIDDGQYKQAIATLQGTPTKDGNIYQMLGDLYYRLGDFGNAYNNFSKVRLADLESENFLLYFNCVVTLNKTSQIPTFYDQLNKIKSLNASARNNVLYKIAETFYNDKDYNKTETVLAMWLDEFRNDEHYDKVLFMQAMCQKFNKKYDLAIINLSRLQKIKKIDTNDFIYKESFAEKGELYFTVREYHSAIEDFKKYMSFEPRMSRYEPVCLQLGNAYYNIKDYKNSYITYSKYIEQFGASEELYTKVANSLLKPERYEEIRKYFADKTNIGEYANYVYYYASYKLADSENSYISREIFNTNENSQYLHEMIYLSILFRNEHKSYDGLNDEFNIIKSKLTKYSPEQREKVLSIKNEYLKAFIYLGEPDLAESLFTEDDVATLYATGKSFFDGVYIEHAATFFNKIISKNYLSKLDPIKLEVLVNFYYWTGDFPRCYQCCNVLAEKNSSDKNILMKFEAAYKLNNVDACQQLGKSVKNSILQEYFGITNEFFQDNNIVKYKKRISDIINRKKIDNVLSRQILLKYLQLEFESGSFENVLSLTSKIPEKEYPSLSPEFKFLQASAWKKLKNDKKAIAEYLKIYYIYQNNAFWVEKAVREIVEIYKATDEIDKAKKVIEMYENRFFLNKFKL